MLTLVLWAFGFVVVGLVLAILILVAIGYMSAVAESQGDDQ